MNRKWLQRRGVYSGKLGVSYINGTGCFTSGPGCSNAGYITIQRISIKEINNAIRRIVIYPVDSAIQRLNNWGLYYNS